jgi:DNA topoisomerase-3
MMTTRKLILAEKPQVARDLAKVLGVSGRSDGALTSERYVITWCIGHLVELCEPHEYDPAWKPWRIDRLPMLPKPFKLRPIRTSLRQWKVVRELLRSRSFAAVINACDAGREGELIFRLCYELAGCRLPIERLWISSLTEQAISQGLSSLRPGREFDNLASAARCRTEADWLVGMNATRAVTVWRRGADSVLCSLGRVQTPTLGIMVQREQQIRRFVPCDYFEVQARLRRRDAKPPDSVTFVALFQHGKHKRLATRDLADLLVQRDTPAEAIVESVEEKKLREPPPLLFDLTSLQRTCNRRFGWSAQHTLSQAQRLYEAHKLLSYPRTDSRHLGRDLIPQLPRLFAAVAESPVYARFATSLAQVLPPRRVFQDQKVTDHHAIIPTTTTLTAARLAALSGDERKLHDVVVRRFLGVFYPDAEFAQTTLLIRVDAVGEPSVGPVLPVLPLLVDAEGRLPTLPPPPDRYQAQGKQRLVAGWQEVAGLEGDGPVRRKGSEDSDGGDDEGEEPLQNQLLPRLREGERVVGDFSVLAKQTRPPPRYSDASLLSAMESAGKQLDDEELRRIMKDTGLGTPATRASVIETLISRRYIDRRGKQLWPTELGMDLIGKLPEASLASAELTGQWEARLNRMARGEDSAADFMTSIVTYVEQLVGKVRGTPPPAALTSSAAMSPAEPRQRSKRSTAAPAKHSTAAPAKRSTAAPAKRFTAAPAKRSNSVSKRSNAVPKRSTAVSAMRPESKHPAPGTVVEPALVCPRCKSAPLIWGRSAWGCQDYRSCRLVIPFVVADCRLALRNVAALVRSGRAQVTRQGKRLGLQLRTLDDPAVVLDGAITRAKGDADPQQVR